MDTTTSMHFYGNVEIKKYGSDMVLEIYVLFFIGLMVLFLTITYAVRYGIDTSKQVKSLRAELKEIKRQIKDLENKRNS